MTLPERILPSCCVCLERQPYSKLTPGMCVDCLALYASRPAQERRSAWHHATYSGTYHPVMRQYHARRVAEIASVQGEVWHERL